MSDHSSKAGWVGIWCGLLCWPAVAPAAEPTPPAKAPLKVVEATWANNVQTALTRVEQEQSALGRANNVAALAVMDGVQRNLAATLALYKEESQPQAVPELPSPPHDEAVQADEARVKPDEHSVVVINMDEIELEEKNAEGNQAEQQEMIRRIQEFRKRMQNAGREEATPAAKSDKPEQAAPGDRETRRQEVKARVEQAQKEAKQRQEEVRRRMEEARQRMQAAENKKKDELVGPVEIDLPRQQPHPRIVNALRDQQKQLDELAQRIEQLERMLKRLANAQAAPKAEPKLERPAPGSRDQMDKTLEQLVDRRKEGEKRVRELVQQNHDQLRELNEQMEITLRERGEVARSLEVARRDAAELEKVIDKKSQVLRQLEQQKREIEKRREAMQKELAAKIKKIEQEINAKDQQPRREVERDRPARPERRETRRPPVPDQAI